MINQEISVPQTNSASLQEKKISFEGYKRKLVGRLYGLLCEREKDGEWEKFLDSIIIEILGISSRSINMWALIGKIESLRFLSYSYFRKTIFECITLVDKMEFSDELS